MITWGAACRYHTSKNGRIISLDFDIETMAELSLEFFIDHSSEGIAENGTTMNGKPIVAGLPRFDRAVPPVIRSRGPLCDTDDGGPRSVRDR